MKIIGETIPHKEQRYHTEVTDAQVELSLVLGGEEVWHLRVSKCEDWRAEAALFLQEFTRAMLCNERSIPQDQVDDWRSDLNIRDPGNEPRCPYSKEHRFAENLARLLVAELGLTWAEYQAELHRAR